MSPSQRPVRWWVVGVASALALPACGATPEPDDPTSTSSVAPTGKPTVLLDFEGGSAGSDASTFPTKGRLRGDAVVKTVNEARVSVEARPDGGLAVRFPSHSSSPRPGGAVLVLQPATSDSVLDPGVGDFEFGADFALDGVSEGAGDNGNNLVQRGLAADPTQYKLQVEHGRASCRVAGSQGDVVVSSTSEVQAGRWYTVVCARAADKVTLTLRGDGGAVDQVSEPGASGSLTYPAQTPLVVGGKVSPSGAVVRENSDQFNGAVDNVFVRIG